MRLPAGIVEHCGDALSYPQRGGCAIELVDAVLAAGRVPPLQCLSLDPGGLPRSWHGLPRAGGGRVDEEALRDLLVRAPVGGWPCVFGIDASTIGPAVGGNQLGPGIPSPQLRGSHRLRGRGDQRAGPGSGCPSSALTCIADARQDAVQVSAGMTLRS